MKKILAVSGGIDSVVMLHMFRNDPEAIVAHFDHGIRENSAADAEFVCRLANEYGLECVVGRGKLGEDANEAVARKARWDFLSGLGGKIYTAHHKNDVVESVAINLLRGTGWRGLAAMDERSIERPLLAMGRAEICRYAGEYGLHFREDQSNNTDAYLRNRIREKLHNLPADDISTVADRATKQRELAGMIDEQLAHLYDKITKVSDDSLAVDRESLGALPDEVAAEVLRKVLADAGRTSATRPQLQRLLQDIRKLQNGKQISFGRDYFIKITRDSAVFPTTN